MNIFKKNRDKKAYTGLAGVYDEFMREVPYDRWSSFITVRLKKYGIDGGLVCDLGCGSGVLTTMLSDAGYDMTGIDSSEEMLDQAAKKKGSRDILYLEQDMTEFELYGTMRAFVSTCDALNYITDKKKLRHIFELVHNYLDPDGIFIFDMHTPAYYKKLGDRVFGDTTEDAGYIWDNTYNRATGINEYALTLFKKQAERADESYVRSEETHVERAYSIGYIKHIIKKTGFDILEVKSDYTEKNAGIISERLVYIIKKGIN